MKPTLCLNMIVKNEAKIIARCLTSARPLVSTWVIVDTGSTDGTQDVIRRTLADLPGELHERPWRNFGANRTEALALAKGKSEYILIMDADDELVIPHPERVKIAFETRKGGKVRRLACRNYAEVELASQTTNEEDLEAAPFSAAIYPDSDGVLFDRQSVPDIASIAITPLTLALDASDGTIKKLVATATYSDASTGDVTDEVRWITSDAAKATVDSGYVTAVAAGSASISCTFAGVTSTAPCVVTVSA